MSSDLRNCTLASGMSTEQCAADIAIRVRGLSKRYEIYDAPRDRLTQFVAPRLQRLVGRNPKQYFREFWALKDVCIEVKRAKPSASLDATYWRNDHV